MAKNPNFQFLINRPIWQIFMIHKLEKVSLHKFDPFPRYWVHNHRNRGKNGFFGLKCHFWPLLATFNCGFFVEISTGIEISTMKIMSTKTYNVRVNAP